MIHAIIKTERRTGDRANSIAIDASTRNTKGEVVTPKTQLHTMGERITDQTNIDYAAEWDGVSPYVTVLKGSIADIKMAYAGWPMIDEDAWRAANP